MATKQDDLVSFPIHLSTEVERLFDEMIHRPSGVCREFGVGIPLSISNGNDDCFLLEADLPGVKLEDVTIEVETTI